MIRIRPTRQGIAVHIHICTFTSLGLYMDINASKYCKMEYVFHRTSGEEPKVSARSYCTQLSEILKEKHELVRNFVLTHHANAHKLRKGELPMLPQVLLLLPL